MHRSKGIRPRRVLALIAMLFGAMVTTLLRPAFGQQEVDPTWYNPWAGQNTVVAHASQPRAAIHRHHPTIRPVSSTEAAGKLRDKRPTTRPRPS
jgi:hypothetical protein